MSGMLYECSSLTSLSNISNWNISNLNDMCSMFYGCSSLTSLPGTSNWEIYNIDSRWNIFYRCPNIILSKVIESQLMNY